MMAEAIAETAARTAPRTRMTAAEFGRLPESNTFVELIDGEVVMCPSPVNVHQEIAGHVYFFLRQTVSGGSLLFAPMDVYLDEHNVVQPDLFWVRESSEQCRLIDDYWHGAPDLVAEVLSPATVARDRGVKFDLYEKHGVREYWLVDPEAQFVEVYVLDAGKFARQGLYEPGDTFASPTLGGQTVEAGKLFN